MKRIALKRIPLRTNRFAGWEQLCHRILLCLFLIQFALVWIGVVLRHPVFGPSRWPEGVLLVLCAATTLAALVRHLPAQNVMLASIIILFLLGVVETLGAATGIPFGPRVYTGRVGQELFHPLPWAIPVVWLVAMLNARGVARLILRRWRRAKNYGWWLIGLTGLLVVFFDFALEPFATQHEHYWSWSASRAPTVWNGTPWVNFVGRATTTLLILAFVTPAFIQKRPGQPSPPDFHPLLVWALCNLLFATGVFLEGLRTAAATILVLNLAIVVLAFIGRKKVTEVTAA